MTPQAIEWKLVENQVEADEPIAFDPDVDPYGPTDGCAPAAFWASATIARGRGRVQLRPLRRCAPRAHSAKAAVCHKICCPRG